MTNFSELGLNPTVLQTVIDLGYENPTPIQAQSIPPLLEGKNILAQAQTGTGKTAAFALPILSTLNANISQTQAIVLAPTRELAIQVAEAFQSYAKNLKGFHVLPIYGGQDFRPQLKALKRGAHVVVGTPGRVMDHLRRGTLKLDNVKTVILDEADEMLKMGFQEDVEWILEQIPHQNHQTGLFSATMPAAIKHISKRYIPEAEHIEIKSKTATVNTVEQSFALVNNHHKIEALTRFLDIEEFNAAIIFTRTRLGSSDLSDKLEARGYSSQAINGDMPQAKREQVIKKMKKGTLDIIVATDVAARGIDVERVSLVVNYDIPHDTEAYVHRIGRTGRAGRKGRALLLVTPREKNMLRIIERATKQKITELKTPTVVQVKQQRLQNFAGQVEQVLLNEDTTDYKNFVNNLAQETQWTELDIAAALASLTQKSAKFETEEDISLELFDDKNSDRGRNKGRGRDRSRSSERGSRGGDRDRGRGGDRDRGRGGDRERGRKFDGERRSNKKFTDDRDMVSCRIEIGRKQDLSPNDIVGLIANQCDVRRDVVGKIKICDDHSIVDVSNKVLNKVIKSIYKTKLKHKETRITPV